MSSSPSSRREAGKRILGRIFGNASFGFAARLWDGTQFALGGPLEPFTLVFRDPASFRRLMLRPNTLRFAEAFVEGELEIEGDFFSAIRLANRIEAVRLRARDRFAIALDLLRL